MYGRTRTGGYERGVQELRQQHSEDMAKVVQDIFSHYYISGRNALTIKLIVINPFLLDCVKGSSLNSYIHVGHVIIISI